MSSVDVAWVLSFPVAVVLGLVCVGSRGLGLGLTVAAAAVGAFGLAGDAWMLARQADVAGWRAAPATVETSERGTRANAWAFTYVYEAGGETRRGSRLTYRPRLRGRKDTDALAARYPEGARITVYVDPDDSSRSVVDPKPSYVLPAVGGVLHAGLLAALVAARRRGREAPAARGT